MAYQKPLVEVYQEYAHSSISTQTNILYPCIVGPCYHLVSPSIDLTGSFVGTLSATGLPAADIPNNYPGAKIVESSVKAVLHDILALIETANVTAATGITLTAPVASTKAKAGDKVFVVNAGGSTVFTALVVTTESTGSAVTYTLNRTWPPTLAITGCKVNVTRIVVGEREVTPVVDVENSQITLPATNVTFEGSVGVSVTTNIFSAAVHAKYSALRTDLGDISTVSTTDGLIGLLGKISPDNPLAYAANLALSASNVAVKIVGVEEDSFVGYSETLKTLESAKVYAIVPLSQASSVISLFKNHAEQMSDPTKGMRRIVIGSTTLQTTEVLGRGEGDIASYT